LAPGQFCADRTGQGLLDMADSVIPPNAMHRIAPFAAALALLTVPPVFAAGETPKSLTPAEMKTDNYILPPPEEVFMALRGVTTIDFGKICAAIAKDPNSARSKFNNDAAKAANLGMRVADAFVAVQAKDSSALRRASDVIEILSLELSADLSLRNKIAVANKLADEGKWNELRTILESVRVDVLDEMKANKDKDSVTLATVGGWLRALNIATAALCENYTPDATKILRQPQLVNYLKSRLDALGPKAKAAPFVQKILGQMDVIAKLTDIPDGSTMSEDDVRKLHEISDDLVAAIATA
jgi:hypothetical protein